MNKNVFIVGTDFSVKNTFRDMGWFIHNNPIEADFICFTGGPDISPSLYGQINEGLSHTDEKRDTIEVTLYNKFIGKSFIGICRGGQLLNVLSGGSMVQDLPKMHSGLRSVDVVGGSVTLHEDHHQGMVPGLGAEILGLDSLDKNPEILWYNHTKSLCFQAHPEWGCQVTKNFFFNLIEEKFS